MLKVMLPLICPITNEPKHPLGKGLVDGKSVEDSKNENNTDDSQVRI